jgi:hypothetical protein
VIGERIYSMHKGVQEVGHYEFNFNAKSVGLNSGIYIMQLKTKNKSASIRLVQF